MTIRPLAGTISSILFLAALAAPASAGESGSFLDCGPIENDAERLACFDRVYESRMQSDTVEKILSPEELVESAPATPETEHELVPVEPAPVREEATAPAAVEQARAEAAFGFPRSTYPEDIEVLRSEVIRYGRDSRDRALFYLENGQVWIQTESRRFLMPEKQLMAEVTPGMLGAFYLTLEGKKKRVKVKRIR